VLQKSLLVARYFTHFAGIQLDCCILHSTEKKKGLWIFSVMDGWMSAGIDEWLDGWMVGCKSIKLPNGIPHIMQCQMGWGDMVECWHGSSGSGPLKSHNNVHLPLSAGVFITDYERQNIKQKPPRTNF